MAEENSVSIKGLIREARLAGHDTLGFTTDPELLLTNAKASRGMFFSQEHGGDKQWLEAWIESVTHATHLPTLDDDVRAKIVRELACAYVALEILPAEKFDPSVKGELINKLVGEARFDYVDALYDLVARDRAAIETEIKTALERKTS